MRRSMVATAFSLGLVLCLVGVMVDAVRVMAAESVQVDPSDKVRQVTGIVSVDPGGKSISVESRRKGVVVLVMTSETRVRVDNDKGKVSDIKTGDKVVCKYREVDGENVCTSVKVLRGK